MNGVRGEPDMGEAQVGWCQREVEQELPELGIVWLPARPSTLAPLTSSPRAVRARLAELSNRWRGARAVSVRQEPVPAAYRALYRQIGLDPDVQRTPVEAAVLERMLDGGFLSKGFLADALTIATLDTGVPVWALDADALSGPLGIRLSREGEPFGEGDLGRRLASGQLVVADAQRALALLFGELAPGREVDANTQRLVLFAVRTAGVPQLYVEEALWTCRQLLEDG